MHFVYDNLAVIFVALTASLMGWLFGGTRSDVLVPIVPWLLLFLGQVLIFFPQKHPGEATFEARERVWEAMKKDPFVWIAFGFLALLAIPFANAGLCASCDRALIATGISPNPPVKFLPFCVNKMNHLNIFLLFATAITCALATRHSLTHRGKRLLIEMIVWNGFALAVLGFVQEVSGATGPLWQSLAGGAKSWIFFSTFGYANMAGDYFTTLFGLSFALWRRSDDEIRELYKTNRDEVEKNRYRTFCRRHYHLIPVVLFFFAALNTLSRAAIILVLSLTTVYFVHTFFEMRRWMRRAERVKKGTIALVVTGLVIFFAVQSVPDDLRREVDTLNTEEVLTRVTGKGQYHARVATALWKKHILFGCGGWGYKHFSRSLLTPQEEKSFQNIGGINVHNDYLQFLAEHGAVGFGLIVAGVFLLLAPVFKTWKHLIKDARFAKGDAMPAKPVQIFALPAPAFCMLMAVLATLIHAFGDCPLRSGAILTLFYITLAAIPGFLPEVTSNPEEERHHHATR